VSVSASSTVNGTPSATPVAEPMLERRSLRTMSASVSTLGPLEPSPGNGPAVSSGIGSQLVTAADGVELSVAAVESTPDVAAVVPALAAALPQAARATAPPASASSRRRVWNVDRS
jgi:hypothetical protein